MYHQLGARQSAIDYSLTVSQENIAQSRILRYILQNIILRSLVENSVVGAAAAFGDAKKELDEEISKQRRDQQGQQRALSSSNKMGNALAPSTDNGSKYQSPQQEGVSSALLSATSYKLKGASFSKGRIILNAEATVPGEKTFDYSQEILPFTIRTKIIPTRIVNGQFIEEEGRLLQQPQKNKQDESCNAIGFTSPECRLNTNPLTAGSILGKLLPDIVWIPFGLGVAVPLGKRCTIYRAKVESTDSGDDEVCKIDGSLVLFGH
jgi:hypothetical protein